jgi:hypothetical protein
VSPGGSIVAELLDEDGVVIEGISREDADAIEGEGDALEICWRGEEDLKKQMREGAVRLKLYLEKATVYGFRVRRPPSA